MSSGVKKNLGKGIADTQSKIEEERARTSNKPLKESKANETTPKPEKAQNGANTDAQDTQKAVMGFRAPIGSIARWRAYAKISGQEIGEWCADALNAHMKQANLSDEQKETIETLVKLELDRKSKK